MPRAARGVPCQTTWLSRAVQIAEDRSSPAAGRLRPLRQRLPRPRRHSGLRWARTRPPCPARHPGYFSVRGAIRPLLGTFPRLPRLGLRRERRAPSESPSLSRWTTLRESPSTSLTLSGTSTLVRRNELRRRHYLPVWDGTRAELRRGSSGESVGVVGTPIAHSQRGRTPRLTALCCPRTPLSAPGSATTRAAAVSSIAKLAAEDSAAREAIISADIVQTVVGLLESEARSAAHLCAPLLLCRLRRAQLLTPPRRPNPARLSAGGGHRQGRVRAQPLRPHRSEQLPQSAQLSAQSPAPKAAGQSRRRV